MPSPTRWRPWKSFGGTLVETLRYGENPHQSAALYVGGRRGRASPPRRRSRARSSPTTTSTTPTPPTNWSPSSIRPRPPPWRSSSTPIPAASRAPPTLAEAYRHAFRTDPVSAFGGIVALNRPLDAEAARRDREDIHRGHHRSGGERRSNRHRRREEESPPAARRRPARPARADSDRRSVAGGLLVQDRDAGDGRRGRPEGRHPPRADEGRDAPTCCSPGVSPSTSSRMPSSTPATGRRRASAPAR